MTKETKGKIEQMLEKGNIGYGYCYLNGGGPRIEHVFNLTPENIANYLGSHFLDANKIIITDIVDNLVLDTFGGFINRCPNSELCQKVLENLLPIQCGEKEAEEILMVTRQEFDEFYWIQYEQQEPTEMTMG